jgi:hypothetical protein
MTLLKECLKVIELKKDQTDELIGRYERAMDTLDNLNRKLWHELYPSVPVSAASLIQQVS